LPAARLDTPQPAAQHRAVLQQAAVEVFGGGELRFGQGTFPVVLSDRALLS
jgi:hypothetical protein